MHRSLDLEVPPKKVFTVLAGYSVYSEWVPDVVESRVIFSEGDICYAEFRLSGLGEPVTLELLHDRPKTIQFRQVSCPTRPWRGRWELQPQGSGTRLLARCEPETGGLSSWFRRPRFVLVDAIADSIQPHLQSLFSTTGIPLFSAGDRAAEDVRVLLDVVQQQDRLVVWLLGKKYELHASRED